jgi:hypothetical protein
MKKSLLTLTALLLLATSFPSYSQMNKVTIEEIAAAKNRDLILMIEEPREKMLKKIEKKPKRGSVDEYKADLKEYNENIKQAAAKFWPYKKTNIQYKTYNEIKALSKTKTKDFVVVICLSSEASTYSAGYNFYDGLYWVKDMKEDFEDRKDWMFSSMVVCLIEDFEQKSLFYSPLYDVFPTKASLVAGFKGVESSFASRIEAEKKGGKPKGGIRGAMEASENSQLAMIEMAKRTPKLKEKTLLIREEWLDKELTQETLKKIYPYKFQICDRAFMDNVVMSEDQNYAYGVLLPFVASTRSSNSVINIHYIIDAADSQPLAIAVPSTGAMMMGTSVTGNAGANNFTSKIILNIVEQIKSTSK